jgi:phage shock protein PspC (stress-responsive transcriptional regulator)
MKLIKIFKNKIKDYFDQDDTAMTVLFILTHLLLIVSIGMFIYCAVMGIPVQSTGGGIFYIGDQVIIF